MERRCYLRKHRVTPCRKQRCAPFPARLEPRRATRGPALLTEPGVAMGLGAGAGSERIAHPGPPDLLLCARADLCRSSPVWGHARPGPMDRAGPSAPTTEDYVIGTPGYAVPGPAPRPTRTDPGPEGHVRRESREAWGGAGGGRAASLGRPLVPARFRNRINWRRCEISPPAWRRRASMPPIPREAVRWRCEIFLDVR